MSMLLFLLFAFSSKQVALLFGFGTQLPQLRHQRRYQRQCSLGAGEARIDDITTFFDSLFHFLGHSGLVLMFSVEAWRLEVTSTLIMEISRQIYHILCILSIPILSRVCLIMMRREWGWLCGYNVVVLWTDCRDG